MEWVLRADGVWDYGGVLHQPFPPPAASRVAAHYDEVTRRARRRRRGDDEELFEVRAHHNWCTASEIMASAAEVGGPLRVLDLAGGKGGSVAKLLRAGAPLEHVALVDISADACAAAAERLREHRLSERSSVYCLDATDDGFAAALHRVGELHGPFNLVLLNFAANYLAAPASRFARTLAAVRAVCNKGARLNVAWLLSTSLRSAPPVRRRLWRSEPRGPHSYAFALGDSVLDCEENELDWATLEGCAGAGGFYAVGAALDLSRYPPNDIRASFITREQGAAAADASRLYAAARFAAL